MKSIDWDFSTLPRFESIAPILMLAFIVVGMFGGVIAFSLVGKALTPIPLVQPGVELSAKIAQPDENIVMKWSGDENAQSYTVQVAKDPEFSEVVVNEKSNGNTKVIKGLENDTCLVFRLPELLHNRGHFLVL